MFAQEYKISKLNYSKCREHIFVFNVFQSLNIWHWIWHGVFFFSIAA